ncbi:hypothetical protein RCL1_000830 [Eukaryota sp. TZLM3-RCL]
MVRAIFLASTLKKIGDRSFEFLVPLYLANLNPDSLSAASILMACESAFSMLFSPSVGSYIAAQRNRMSTVSRFIVLQNLSVVVSFLALLFIHMYQGSLGYLRFLVLAVLALSEGSGILSSKGADISLNRDWIPLLVNGDEHLTSVNAILARIDLGTKIGAPVIVGIIFQFHPTFALISIAALNMISFIPEFFLIRFVYKKNQEKLVVVSKESTPSKIEKISRFSKFKHDLNTVKNESTFQVILAYSFLYATVLSPQGALMTVFLASRGIPPTVLSGIRVFNAVSGIMCTFVYKKMVCSHKVGLLKTGNWFSAIQVLCSSLGVFFLLLQYSHLVPLPFDILYVFALFVVFGRFGLYGFSITEQQIVQKYTNSSIRPVASAVENSLTQFFAFIMFSFTAIVSRPEHFYIPACLSLGFLYACAILYRVWYKRTVREEKQTELPAIV